MHSAFSPSPGELQFLLEAGNTASNTHLLPAAARREDTNVAGADNCRVLKPGKLDQGGGLFCENHTECKSEKIQLFNSNF